MKSFVQIPARMLGCALLGATLLTASPLVSQGQTTWPGETWETASPASLGMDVTLLDALRDLVGGSGLVVRDGYVVYQWGNVGATHDWGSASKPVTAGFLARAVEAGLVEYDSRIGEFLEGGSPKDASITFHHLANMISGYARAEGPGEAWAYNDYASNLLGRVLFYEVLGGTPSEIILEGLAPLQFEDPISISDERNGRLQAMSIRDYARLGLLWERQGRWREQQIVPDSFFDRITNHVPADLPRTAAEGPASWDFGTIGGGSDGIDRGQGNYGYTFWVNTNGFWPGAPASVYQANGHWGEEVCFVIPTLGIVAAGVGNWGHPSSEALDLLLRSVGDGTATKRASIGRIRGIYGPGR